MWLKHHPEMAALLRPRALQIMSEEWRRANELRIRRSARQQLQQITERLAASLEP